MIAFVTSAVLAGPPAPCTAAARSPLPLPSSTSTPPILILVSCGAGRPGQHVGSVIAAAALTILPEALRQFADYRMLVYAIVLILVMLATNNPT